MRDTLVCFSVLVVIVVAVIVTWKKWQLYLQSLPDRDGIMVSLLFIQRLLSEMMNFFLSARP